MIWNNQSMHCKSPDKLCKSAKGATGIGSTGKLYYKQEEGVGGGCVSVVVELKVNSTQSW